MKLIDTDTYEQLRSKALEFAQVLKGDAGYTQADSNRLALEAMLLGWFSSTPRFHAYGVYCAKHHQREDVFLTAQDACMQAVSEASLFVPNGHGKSSRQDTKLAAKIRQAKAKLKAKEGN